MSRLHLVVAWNPVFWPKVTALRLETLSDFVRRRCAGQAALPSRLGSGA